MLVEETRQLRERLELEYYYPSGKWFYSDKARVTLMKIAVRLLRRLRKQNNY